MCLGYIMFAKYFFQKNMTTIASTTGPRKLKKPVKKPVMKGPTADTVGARKPSKAAFATPKVR